MGRTARPRSGSRGAVGGKAGAKSACRPPGENVEGRKFLILLGFLVVEEVQFFQCGLEGKDRPEAPSECLQCGGKCRFHRHGSYERYGGVSGEERVKVMRFLCPRCGRTWSVIPSGRLPYWSLGVAQLERHLNEESELAGEGARPPPAPEIERGCIRRAHKRLSERTNFLCGLLGQQMPWLENNDLGCFWRALRKLGSLGEILVRLARDFKTSLFGCYRSFRPHWQRVPDSG